MARQGELFPRRLPQQRRQESSKLYASVCALRAAGRRVWRVGRVNMVDGERLSDQRVIALADREGRLPLAAGSTP